MSAPAEATIHDATRRNRQLVRAASGGVVLRFCTVMSTVAMYAIAARVLTDDNLGVWLTVTSLYLVMTVGDFGLGASVTDSLASGGGPAAPRHLRRSVVAVAYPAVMALALAVIAISITVFVATPLARELGAPGDAADAFVAVLCVVGLTIPLSIGGRVLEGVQLGWQANLAQAAGIVLGLLLFGIAATVSPSLFALSITAVSGRFIGNLLCCLVSMTDSSLIPRRAAFRWSALIELARPAGWFFLIGVSAVVSFGIDSLVLAGAKGPTAVAEYSAAYRLFTFAPIMTFIVLQSVWPAFAEALHHDDRTWIAVTYRRITSVGFLANLLAAAILLVSIDVIVRVWLDDNVVIGSGTALLAAGAAIAHGMVIPAALLSMGLGDLSFQAKVTVIGAVVNAALSIPLAFAIGASGPLLGSMIGLVVTWLALAHRNHRLLLAPEPAEQTSHRVGLGS